MSFWDQRYGAPGFAYGTEPNDFLVAEVARLPPGGRVLCLAEGEGRNAVFLAERGFDVHAVDLSPVGMAKAETLAASRGVQVRTEVADLAAYPIEASAWDGVVSISAHLPSAVRADLHRRVVLGLGPGGVLLLEAYTPRQLLIGGIGGPPAEQADRFMTLAALREELSGLELLVGRELDRTFAEGPFHRGLGAVVQVVARKPPLTDKA